MSDAPPGNEPKTAEDERLTGLLALLRVETEAEGDGVTPGVLRRARWQLVVRDVARTATAIGAAAGDGLAVLFGIGSRRR